MLETGILSIVACLAVVFLVIWRLTSLSDHGVGLAPDPTEADAAEILLPVLKDGGSSAVRYASRDRSLGEVLRDMMVRMGMASDAAASVLEAEGFTVPSPSVPDAASGLGVVSFRQELMESALERALVVGISLARRDDDHAAVGDDALDLESLAQEAEETELTLFGEGRRERHAFYTRAVVVLQDMVRSEQDPARRATITDALERFTDAVRDIQADMARIMSRLPQDVDRLTWGDGADRRMYYFKMGVTNSLRRSRVLDSLGHLYRYKGVDYDVVEAYDMASRECSLLARAEALDVDRLLTMGPAEVQGIVRGAISS